MIMRRVYSIDTDQGLVYLYVHLCEDHVLTLGLNFKGLFEGSHSVLELL